METSELLKRVRQIEIKTRGLSNNIFAGEYHSAFKGRGMAFAEVREYQYGDDIRDIEWNVTARFNKPFVKVFEEERSGSHDEKVFKRELLRLETSLKSAGDLPKLVFLHYPPRYKGYTCDEILELLDRYNVRWCYYGHLHGASHGLAMEGQWDGITYKLVSADRLNFKPHRIF